MDIKEMIAGDYLKSEDVPTDGVVVTIIEVKRNDRYPDKMNIRFKGSEQMLMANKTNLRIAAGLFKTAQTDDWIGKKIVLFNDPTVEFGDVPVGGLRFRPLTSSEAAGATPAGETDEKDKSNDIPF